MGFESIPPVFGDFHFQPDSPPTCPLRPVIPKNTCPPRLTAAAGTELAGASSSTPVMFAHSTKEPYTPAGPSLRTRPGSNARSRPAEESALFTRGRLWLK